MIAGLILFAAVAHFVVFAKGGIDTTFPPILLVIPAILSLLALIAGPHLRARQGGRVGAVFAMALGESAGFVGLVVAILVGAEAWGIAFTLVGCLAIGRVLLAES